MINRLRQIIWRGDTFLCIILDITYNRIIKIALIIGADHWHRLA
jgi:hypothetical protein